MDVESVGAEVGQRGRGRGRAAWIAGVAALAVVAGGATYVVTGRDETPKATAGTGATPTATASSTSADIIAEEKLLAGIDATLKGRAAALVAGRLPQFLAFTDPKNAKLVQSDKQLFANLQQLGLKQLSYVRVPTFSPEQRTKLGPGARALRIRMLVQLEGIDQAPRVTQIGYAFAQRGGRWVVVDNDDAEAANRGDSREPWELGPIEVARGRGVLVVSSPGEAKNGRRLVREAEAAIPAVRAATKRAQAGILVVAMAARRSWDSSAITGGHPAGAVAIPNMSPANADASEFKVTGSRVVINPTYRKTSDRFLLAHEFTHAAMAPLGFGAPIWLVEGYAEYVERHLLERSNYSNWVGSQRRDLRKKAIKSLVVLPIDGVFHGDYDEDSYGVAWLIVEYLANKYGVATVNALYAETAAQADDPALRDKSLSKHLKLTETALVAALKKYTGPS
ncbi:hypothetical protein [Kribbella catacumbae]|uniref:hypothetical protein n=1 Tax=Kribbella catacumbae TaxID=460086 RepID=UPI0003A64DA6|nr:hypothetical protein [Kribbella catacumbae]